MDPLNQHGTNQGNPVGLNPEVADKMGKALDRHLSSMLVLYQQYHKHHWLIEGPQFRDLHLFFSEQYDKLHELYDQFAERLTVLGVIPTCHPTNVVALSYIDHEPEGQFTAREMLENDLAAEKQMAIELRATFKEALEMGDVGTSYLVQEATYKCEDRAQHILHFLEEDTLPEEMTVGKKEEA